MYSQRMNPKVSVTIVPPQNPTTPEEWQLAVDAAQALLCLDSARQYGLVKGGPAVDAERCEEIINAGQAQGIAPRPDCVERWVGEWNSQPGPTSH